LQLPSTTRNRGSNNYQLLEEILEITVNSIAAYTNANDSFCMTLNNLQTFPSCKSYVIVLVYLIFIIPDMQVGDLLSIPLYLVNTRITVESLFSRIALHCQHVVWRCYQYYMIPV